MPNEVTFIAFIAMVTAMIINVICAVDHKKAEKDCKKWEIIYHDSVIRSKKKFWDKLGAYPAEKEGYMYVDVPGGVRLVIFEGKIDGWYEP